MQSIMSYFHKPSLLLFSLFFAFFALFQEQALEAGGWGKTDQQIQYEGTKWNGVYFDNNGLYFNASVPNSSGTSLQNGLVTFQGSIGNDIGYVITTTFNPGYTPPASLNEFVKIVQEANPSYIVTAIDAKALGAKYAVDMIPKSQDGTAFWRFLTTKDRLIKMGTDDDNGNRRYFFFESIYIH